MFLVWPSTSGIQRLFTSNAILSICRIILEILSLSFGCVWCILYVECVIWGGEAFLCSELCYYVSWPIFAIIRSVRTHNNPETTEKQCRIHSTKKTEKRNSPNQLVEMCWGWEDTEVHALGCLRSSGMHISCFVKLYMAACGSLFLPSLSLSLSLTLSSLMKSVLFLFNEGMGGNVHSNI